MLQKTASLTPNFVKPSYLFLDGNVDNILLDYKVGFSKFELPILKKLLEIVDIVVKIRCAFDLKEKIKIFNLFN